MPWTQSVLPPPPLPGAPADQPLRLEDPELADRHLAFVEKTNGYRRRERFLTDDRRRAHSKETRANARNRDAVEICGRGIARTRPGASPRPAVANGHGPMLSGQSAL